MEERVQVLEKNVRVLERLLAELLSRGVPDVQQGMVPLDVEKRRMRLFWLDIEAAVTSEEKLAVFITLFPLEARDLLKSKFDDAVALSGCPVGSLHIWRLDDDPAWNCTLKSGSAMQMFSIDGNVLEVSCRKFHIERERGMCINRYLRSYCSMFFCR